MGKGYFSQLKDTRERKYTRYYKRRQQGICVACCEQLNHYASLCDYHHLLERIKKLEKNYNRLIKLCIK